MKFCADLAFVRNIDLFDGEPPISPTIGLPGAARLTALMGLAVSAIIVGRVRAL